MPLIVKHTERLQHPTEPGAWVDLSVPITVGDLASAKGDASNVERTIAILARVVVGWSYDNPPSEETLGSLDIETFHWLEVQAFALSARPPLEKKDTNGSSPDGLAPASDSLMSLTT